MSPYIVLVNKSSNQHNPWRCFFFCRWSTASSSGSQPATVQYQMCGVYGGNQFDLSSLPSNAWQIACVLYGGGCVLLGFGSLAAAVSLVLPNVWSTRLACYTGYIQTMAGRLSHSQWLPCLLRHGESQRNIK